MPSSALNRRLRTLLIAVTGLVVVALVGSTAGAVWAVRRSFPQLDGVANVAGLNQPVEVFRDRWGVPQLYAHNAEDLFYGQGFVHAQDRFWEMDVRRHATAGRLSEMFGESTLATDKLVRTMGWYRTAEAEIPLLNPNTQRYLNAYSLGVNAYLKSAKGSRLSVEYPLLGLENGDYRPEPWKPADSVAWLKAMAWDLRANMNQEMERARLATDTRLTRAQIEQLYPPYPYERHNTILGRGNVAGRKFDPAATAPTQLPAGARDALAGLSKELGRIPQLIGSGGPGTGSNSWVVDGSRTASGKPLLANDPHLAPKLPSVWYQMGLHCLRRSADCPFDTAGFTFSGMPGVVIGHNDRIAWGFTNVGADVADLFLERVDDTDDTYEYEGQRRRLDVRLENITVASGGESQVQQIKVRTVPGHGPLISDSSAQYARAGKAGSDPGDRVDPGERPGQQHAVALKWTALEPSKTMDAVFAIDSARDWNDFRSAARLFAVPAQNMLYADVAGNIGYQLPGNIPVRRSGDGQGPVPGWLSSSNWDSYIPFEELPYVKNPKEGLIVTANNAVVGPGYPYVITEDWSYGYRSQRIRDLLVSRGTKLDAQGMRDIQSDNRNAVAGRLTKYLLDVKVDEFTAPAQDLLRHWDHDQNANSAAAAYFNGVWRYLLRFTYGDELPKDLEQPDGGERWYEVVQRILDDPTNRWWDDQTTPAVQETRDMMLQRAMIQARRELTARLGKDPSTWKWGRLHKLWLTNGTLGESGNWALESLLNRGPYRLSGGSGTPNASSWNSSKGYTPVDVPSMRMVVDLSAFDQSSWINLTGASGHAYHENYTDQTLLWASGEQLPFPFSQRAVRAATVHRLQLVPES